MELTDAEVALAAAQTGADVVRHHYRTALEKHLKVGSDFATDADLEAETAIRAVLTEGTWPTTCTSPPGSGSAGQRGAW